MFFTMRCRLWGNRRMQLSERLIPTLLRGPFKLDKSRDGKGLLFTSKEIDVRNSIDPCFFEEDGKKWLFWGSFNGIYAVQLSDDGMNVLNGDLEAAKKNKVKIAGTAFEASVYL